MQLSITTRHYEADGRIKEYLSEKLAKLQNFFSRIISARAVLTKEGYRHIVEITVCARNMQLVAKEASRDMHSAVDLAVGKLEKRLTRFRDKTKEHKARRLGEKLKRQRLITLDEGVLNRNEDRA